MMIRGKKYFDNVTLEKAVKLIEAGKLTLIEICRELHTYLPVLKRSMDLHFGISTNEDENDQVDWLKSYEAKQNVDKRKKNTRIVYECQSCSYESEIEIERCPKCLSGCIRKRELRNKVSSGELKAEKMTGRRKEVYV